MKLGKKISFGINAVVAGQKTTTTNAEPQLTVNSTIGKFTVTSPVSKALNIAVGENIMFLNNIAGVEMAIQNRSEDILAYCAENGIDIDSREGVDRLLAELSQWFIAKGVLMYAKGEPVMATERMTKEDKIKFIEENGLAIVEEIRDQLVEKFGDLSNEELVLKLTPDMVESPKYHAASGSKTSTSGSTTGVGCQLNFTDSNVWNALKADLGDAKETKNRVFDVALDEAQLVDYNNGKEVIKINILPLYFKEDTNPIIRAKKEEVAE